MVEDTARVPECGDLIAIRRLEAVSAVKIGQRANLGRVQLISAGVAEVLSCAAGVVVDCFGVGVSTLEKHVRGPAVQGEYKCIVGGVAVASHGV